MFHLIKFHRLRTLWKWRRCIMIFILILGFTCYLRRSRVDPSGYDRGSDIETYLPKHRKVNHRANHPNSNNTMDHSMTKIRFEQRKKHLEQQCQVLRQYYLAQHWEILVKYSLIIDTRHQLVYCATQQIGGRFWRRIFQILNGLKNVSNPFDIREMYPYEGYITAQGMSFDTIHKLLMKYETFMFVQDPFERLLSDYVDKLFAYDKAYWNLIGNFMVSKFRRNLSNLSLECQHDITFEEYVRYMVDSIGTTLLFHNFQQCRPCEIQYDYIGKEETFEEDTFFLMDKFNIADKFKFDDFKSEAEDKAILDAVDYVFLMKAEILKCISFSEALFRCFRKLQIRGILSKDVQYPFQVNVDRDTDINEFKKAMLDLHAISGPSEERSKNWREAFIEAYSLLPLDLWENITEAVFIDTSLLGYDRVPFSIRNKESIKDTSFKYFSLPAFPKVKYLKRSQN